MWTKEQSLVWTKKLDGSFSYHCLGLTNNGQWRPLIHFWRVIKNFLWLITTSFIQGGCWLTGAGSGLGGMVCMGEVDVAISSERNEKTFSSLVNPAHALRPRPPLLLKSFLWRPLVRDVRGSAAYVWVRKRIESVTDRQSRVDQAVTRHCVVARERYSR